MTTSKPTEIREFWVDPTEVSEFEDSDDITHKCGNCFSYKPDTQDFEVFHVIEYAAYEQLKDENERLRLSQKDPVLEYFGACENCEPLMCCSGSIQMACGCRGMPMDFKPTDKCQGDCNLKLYAEITALKAELLKTQKKFLRNGRNKMSLLDLISCSAIAIAVTCWFSYIVAMFIFWMVK